MSCPCSLLLERLFSKPSMPFPLRRSVHEVLQILSNGATAMAETFELLHIFTVSSHLHKTIINYSVTSDVHCLANYTINFRPSHLASTLPLNTTTQGNRDIDNSSFIFYGQLCTEIENNLTFVFAFVSCSVL